MLLPYVLVPALLMVMQNQFWVVKCKCSEKRSITDEELILAIKANADVLLETKTLVDTLNVTMKHLARQLVLSQLYLEEKTRSDGDSGLKQIRLTSEGSRPYHATSHTGRSMAAIHDHANNIRTIGMGEVIAVMNGLEFRTRHNDYRLYMPSKTSENFHKVEEIQFPDVPPEVLAKSTVTEQVLEMREWFRAWKEQDYSVRDYRQYFKPVLCYMEGAWTYANEQVDESFFSDRHQIDARDWFELQEKVRFSSYSGAKQSAENIPYLPKIIINVTESHIPIFAQWNYRILCHPLSRDLPLNRLRLEDDLKGRMNSLKNYTAYEMSKSARFRLNPLDNNNFRDRSAYNKLLEELMNEIPGKNNYQSNLKDHGYDGLGKDPTGSSDLNAGYYHRRYAVQIDASGHQTRNRGFSDQNLYMALTSHDQVVGMDNYKCTTGENECPTPEYRSQKWTYAFPLEIIYLTPLNTWNPYDIAYKGSCRSAEGKSVTVNGRDGSEDQPFDGNCHSSYYRTPSEFFELDEYNPDPADTSIKGNVFVLDKDGNKRAVRASGTRIIFPHIHGLGKIRQRYPIAPVHGEGSAVWKELEALQDVVLSPKTYGNMYYEHVSDTGSGSTSGGSSTGDVNFKTATTQIPFEHYHTFKLTENEMAQLQGGETVNVTTSQAQGHVHQLQLTLEEIQCKDTKYMYRYKLCDGRESCWDSHGVCIEE